MLERNSSKLLVSGENSLHVVDLQSSPNAGEHPTLAFDGLRAMMQPDVAETTAEVLVNLPKAASAVAVASFRTEEVSGQSGARLVADVLAVAPANGEVLLSTFTDLNINPSAAGPQLEFATRMAQLPQVVPGARAGIRSLHLCSTGAFASNEPILWVADALGCLSGVGLESGAILGRWSFSTPEGSSASVALAGNATHLILVIRGCAGAPPAVLSAPYAHIRNSLHSSGCRT